MSKGWESKSVEEQQAEAAAAKQHSPTEVAAAKHRVAGERQRRIQALELQRELVLSQRTASSHRRSALATIETELEELGWTIKL